MLRKNLFIGIPNDRLKECYESYKRVSCKMEEEKELFSDLVTEYKTFVESEHPKAAEAICQADMFNEIAHRFFKIVDVIKDKEFCEIMGIEVKTISKLIQKLNWDIPFIKNQYMFVYTDTDLDSNQKCKNHYKTVSV